MSPSGGFRRAASPGLFRRGAALLWLLLVPLFLLAIHHDANAAVNRYAVVIGNDTGRAGEAKLRYAEDDAKKVMGVLQSLGNFRPENSVLLLGKGAQEVQRVLISLNARIRSETTGARDSVLFVYYSGHADQDALHLGHDSLELSLLKRMVQGSAAAFRLLVLDACRSGALTRVKGAHPAPSFQIATDGQLPGEGVAFLTSSAAGEDAQESDELQGSFFTHYFVSGLRGAADKNGNAVVSVEEAYDYAYQHTLSASSRTAHGLQHPTFHFDLRGKGSIQLTWVRAPGSGLGLLAVPKGRTVLLFGGDESGPVIAEVGVMDAQRELALDPGRYFVRARAGDYLLEGFTDVNPGQSTQLSEADLTRVEYARLARKGGSARHWSHGPWLATQVRSALLTNIPACLGARLGYSVDLPEITLGGSLGACRAPFENANLSGRADELSLEVAAAHVFDLPLVSLALGAHLGGAWFHQSFETQGIAPERNSAAANLGVTLGGSVDVWRGWYLLVEPGAQIVVFSQQRTAPSARREEPELRAVLTARGLVGLGKRF